MSPAIALVCLLLFMFCQATETAFRFSFKFRQKHKDNTPFLERIITRFYKTPGWLLLNLRFVALTTIIIGILSFQSIHTEFLPYLSETNFTLLSIGILTLTFIFIGILLPRTICGHHPDKALKALALPLYLADILLSPIAKLVFLLPRLIMRLLKIPYNDKHLAYLIAGRELMDPKLRPLLSTSAPDIRENDLKIYRKALDFSNIKVRDCIVPRTEIIAVDKNDDFNTLIHTFINSGKSKIIIYEEDLDHIIGYVHSSDLFKPITKTWKESIRQLPIVPESMNAQKMMLIFMQQKKSVAVVVDEFGGTTGIISLEDIVEEIFGDIEDEHDTVSLTAKQTAKDQYLLSARLEIEKANELFNINLPVSEEYLTISGMILYHYQDFPKQDQTISIGQFKFKILKTSTAKIDLVELKIES